MKLSRTICIIAAGVIMSSCSKFDFLLDFGYDNAISYDNMWQDEVDVTSSVYGIYYRMRNCFVQDEINVFYWGEARVGSYMWGPGLDANSTDAVKRAVLNSTMTGATGSCSWSALYSTIDQANQVLKYAPGVTMGTGKKDFALGQALFARAYCYFWAARLWGDVPLVLVPVESAHQEETYPVRTPVADVLAQIEKDITEAEKHANQLGSDSYFATPAALYALKAEFALWMYSTQKAGDGYLTMAEDALSHFTINSSLLLDNYGDVFSRTNKQNKEVIFALNNNQTEKLLGGYYFFFYHPSTVVENKYRNNPVPLYKTQWWSYSQNFVDILQASKSTNGDKRVATNLGIGNYGKDDGRILSWPNKFLGEMTGTANVVLDCDLLYYRAAQLIMMDAEVKYYRKNYTGALSSLNLIAKRAYGKANFYTDVSEGAVLDALVKEYFLEFPCEGVIWWALIRLDKIWEYNPDLAVRRAENPNILLWPLTNSAINKNNKLKQTEGWS